MLDSPPEQTKELSELSFIEPQKHAEIFISNHLTKDFMEDNKPVIEFISVSLLNCESNLLRCCKSS